MVHICQHSLVGMELAAKVGVSYTIAIRANWLRNSAGFFVTWFCSLPLLVIGLDYAQNTKGIEMHMNN